mmetsp:Transcript_4335/g.6704  ORF Transcript_4335/g.6704 Transcript_4335/m.6704 type:complete len:101 (-) Transcript_4335:2489-2791(-)
MLCEYMVGMQALGSGRAHVIRRNVAGNSRIACACLPGPSGAIALGCIAYSQVVCTATEVIGLKAPCFTRRKPEKLALGWYSTTQGQSSRRLACPCHGSCH